MAEPIIGAAPAFDPHASSRAARGSSRLRGRRLRLIFGLAIMFAAGLWLFQSWLLSWRSEPAQAAIEVKPSRSDAPNFTLEPASIPMLEPPPIPVQETPPAKREPLRRTASDRQQQSRSQPQLPTQVTWSVTAQGTPDLAWFTDGRRPHLAHGCALRPGASIIPAVLETVVQSEVSGQVLASVSEDVYDADGVGRLLIPQGTKLVGVYNSDLTFTSRRLGIVWTELTMPNGTQLNLAEANGMDVAGSMGMGGEVTTAWGQVILVAAVFSVFEAAQRATVPDDDYASNLGDAAANQFGRAGTQVIRKLLDSAVKIRIPAGSQLNVSVGRTVQVC